jgi:Tfp pilus assembly protein PilZ
MEMAARVRDERELNGKLGWDDPRREPGSQTTSGTWTVNRRKSTRVPARGLATHIQTEAGSTPGLVVENISMTGLFIRSANAMRPGTQVMLQLIRPGFRHALQLTGVVVSVITPAEARKRSRTPGIGVSLDTIDIETRERLRALLDDLERASQAAAQASVLAKKGRAEAQKETEDAPPVSTGRRRRIAELETEVSRLRSELLRRNRTIVELMNKIAIAEGKSQ